MRVFFKSSSLLFIKIQYRNYLEKLHYHPWLSIIRQLCFVYSDLNNIEFINFLIIYVYLILADLKKEIETRFRISLQSKKLAGWRVSPSDDVWTLHFKENIEYYFIFSHYYSGHFGVDASSEIQWTHDYGQYGFWNHHTETPGCNLQSRTNPISSVFFFLFVWENSFVENYKH